VRDLAAVQRRWPGWLDRVITRRVPLARYDEALRRGPDDVKVVVDIAADMADSADSADIEGTADPGVVSGGRGTHG
jgi:hypothetical protein